MPELFDEDAFETAFDKAEEEVEKPKLKFIIRTQRVDQFNLVRSRKLLTPSMCTKPGCNYDAAKMGVDGAEGWDDIDPAHRNTVLQALKHHIAEVHNESEELIVDEDKLPTQWLGTNKKLFATV